jgi:hypothetical protein
MRTTVELPPELLRAAKARAAERGEALKALFARAISRELARSAPAVRAEHAAWPLISSRRKGTVRLTNADLAGIDAADEAGRPGGAGRSRQ